MNYKVTYKPKIGYTPLCEKGKSSFQNLEFGIIELNAGDQICFETKHREAAFILLCGKAVFNYDQVSVSLGIRKSVFSSDTEALYLPHNKTVHIFTDWYVKIAVCMTPCEEDGQPAIIRPKDYPILTLGQLNWTRKTSFIIDERVSQHLFVGEAFPIPGNWAGFPPHKHDEDRMPFEDIQEELYYFLFQPEEGFALQALYTRDKSIDVCYKVNNNELVEFPRGYHTTVAAPCYQTYFLWASSVRYAGMFRSSDPDHSWIEATENLLKTNTH